MPSRVIQVESAAYESEYELTAASNGQAIAAVALGVANVVGVSFLGTLLADPMNRQLLAVQGFGFVMGLMPVLQTYAAAFFTIPAVRCAPVLSKVMDMWYHTARYKARYLCILLVVWSTLWISCQAMREAYFATCLFLCTGLWPEWHACLYAFSLRHAGGCDLAHLSNV